MCWGATEPMHAPHLLAADGYEARAGAAAAPAQPLSAAVAVASVAVAASAAVAVAAATGSSSAAVAAGGLLRSPGTEAAFTSASTQGSCSGGCGITAPLLSEGVYLPATPSSSFSPPLSMIVEEGGSPVFASPASSASSTPATATRTSTPAAATRTSTPAAAPLTSTPLSNGRGADPARSLPSTPTASGQEGGSGRGGRGPGSAQAPVGMEAACRDDDMFEHESGDGVYDEGSQTYKLFARRR